MNGTKCTDYLKTFSTKSTDCLQAFCLVYEDINIMYIFYYINAEKVNVIRIIINVNIKPIFIIIHRHSAQCLVTI